MKKKPTPIDTNLIIRFLANDTPNQAKQVESLLKQSKKNELELPDVIIAEIVWVLLSFYKLTKEEVIEKLEGLLLLDQIKINRRILNQTIILYRQNNISYTDAYLLAYSIIYGESKVFSFDKGLDRVREIKRKEP